MTEAERFWADYCEATGHTGPLPDVDWFGDSPALADELLALVLSGDKRGTACLARDFTSSTQPKVGDHWIITDGHKVPRAIIRTSQIEICPVRDVTESFARIEGEGDKTLVWWKSAHDAYYTRQGAAEGFVYTDDMDCICEQFDLVWTQ